MASVLRERHHREKFQHLDYTHQVTDIYVDSDNNALRVNFAEKLHGNVFGLHWRKPLPMELVRIALIVKNANDGKKRMVNTWMKADRVLRWNQLAEALGGVNTEGSGTVLNFKYKGWIYLPYETYRDKKALVFKVYNLGQRNKGRGRLKAQPDSDGEEFE